MSMKAVPALTIGLLATLAVVGVIAIASGPGARTIPISDLAQLAKQGQITTIEVSGDTAINNPQLTMTTDPINIGASVTASCDVDLTDFELNAMRLLELRYTLECRVLNRDVQYEQTVLAQCAWAQTARSAEMTSF